MALSAAFITFVRELAITMGIPVARRAAHEWVETAIALIRRRRTGLDTSVGLASLRETHRRRYIVAPPPYHPSAGPTVQQSLRDLQQHLQDVTLKSEGAEGAKVLALSTLEAVVLQERFRGLLIEEDVQYRLTRTPLLGAIEPIVVPRSTARTLTIHVRSRHGVPVVGARVVLLPAGTLPRGYEGVSDAAGQVRLAVRKADTRFARVTVLPQAGYWSRVWKHVEATPIRELVLRLAPLPVAGFDWGHQATGAAQLQPAYRGRGVRVAVIDSGIAPHRSLHVAGGHNFLLGEAPDAWDDDTDGHGTHCAGVVAAVHHEASVWGYVPQASLYALRVFGGADGGGHVSDIRDAIKWAIRTGCDVINLSLGSQIPSSYLRMAIAEATDAGVLCVAAAGNDGGPVDYPARFRDVVGVSAVGRMGTYPRSSIHREAQSRIRGADRTYFLASFSNRGEEIDLCAPGVAVTSTLPAGAFGAWDGTSMGTPHVAGIAALALETAPELLHARRDAERTVRVLDRVLSLCVDLGMARQYQGAGLPLVSRLLAT